MPRMTAQTRQLSMTAYEAGVLRYLLDTAILSDLPARSSGAAKRMLHRLDSAVESHGSPTQADAPTGLIDLANDMNASASDAMDALVDGNLAEVRTNLSAILDAVREIIEAGEGGKGDSGGDPAQQGREILTVLDVSTAHLTVDECVELSAGTLPGQIYAGDTGGLIYVHADTSDRPPRFSDHRWAIEIWAAKQGCGYLMFDADSLIHDQFPIMHQDYDGGTR